MQLLKPQESLTRLQFYAIMFISEAAKIVKSDLNIPITFYKFIMSNPFAVGEVEPYFFTKKQVVKFLNTSISTYDRQVKAGKAPRGRQLFGSQRKFFPKSEIILFAQGNWEAAQ